MKLLYIEHYAGSPEMGMEFRPYYLSREWVKMGHKIFILVGDGVEECNERREIM